MAVVPKAKIGQWNENTKLIVVGCHDLCPSSPFVLITASLCVHPDTSFSLFPQQLSPTDSGIPTDQNYPSLILTAVRPVILQSGMRDLVSLTYVGSIGVWTFCFSLILGLQRLRSWGISLYQESIKRGCSPHAGICSTKKRSLCTISGDVFCHLWF